ncbi:MAG: carbohydrate ABC transporter substrate-binding protein [Oscillospiraceae bacterium]|nr:carbohydrate ABC transporter substrate-binding protein [Oscillospiraceae bacterium]
MKRLLALVLAGMLLLCTACGEKEPETPQETITELTFWTYPYGNFDNPDTVNMLLMQFQSVYPNIRVHVEYLTEENADEVISAAIDGGETPDIVFTTPNRPMTDWSSLGCMVDLAPLWDDNDRDEVLDACESSCFTTDGACYLYPIAMNVSCMAINYDAFVRAGADKYVDLETRTWSDEDFIKACRALYDTYHEPVAAVYCGGQNGDYGTRALVSSLFGGRFTNETGTGYAVDSEEMVRALDLLQDMKGVIFDETIVAQDEALLFYLENLKMSFYWDVQQQMDPVGAGTGVGLTKSGQRIEYMYYPSATEEHTLPGEIWGMCLFHNGDEARLAAAKQFVKFFADGEGTASAVRAAGSYPVRNTAEGNDLTKLWVNNTVMDEYGMMLTSLGEDESITPNWPVARSEWYKLLQRLGQEEAVAADEAAKFMEAVR